MIPTLGLQLSTNQKQAVFCPTGLEWDPHLSAREKRTHLLCLIPLPTKKKQNKKPFEVILPSTSSPFLLFRTACSLSVPWNRPHQSMWTHKKKKSVANVSPLSKSFHISRQWLESMNKSTVRNIYKSKTVIFNKVGTRFISQMF